MWIRYQSPECSKVFRKFGTYMHGPQRMDLEFHFDLLTFPQQAGPLEMSCWPWRSSGDLLSHLNKVGEIRQMEKLKVEQQMLWYMPLACFLKCPHLSNPMCPVYRAGFPSNIWHLKLHSNWSFPPHLISLRDTPDITQQSAAWWVNRPLCVNVFIFCFTVFLGGNCNWLPSVPSSGQMLNSMMMIFK